jgi:hypothetical protein
LTSSLRIPGSGGSFMLPLQLRFTPAACPFRTFFTGCSILSRGNLDSMLSILGLRESQWENSCDLQGYRILGCHDHNTRYLEMAVPNRRRTQDRQDGNEDQPVGHPPRSAADQSRAEAGGARTFVVCDEPASKLQRSIEFPLVRPSSARITRGGFRHLLLARRLRPNPAASRQLKVPLRRSCR